MPLDLYRKEYPQAQVKLTSGQQLQQQLQPRFMPGQPAGPDRERRPGPRRPGQQKQLVVMDRARGPCLRRRRPDAWRHPAAGRRRGGVYDGKKYEMPYGFGLGGIWYCES